ncbi:MAG: hypothetical protein EA427_17220, partial [Spirochaetaceae bacterium]
MVRMRVYHFSGTGNSLAVARKIAESVPDTELVSIVPLLHSPEASAISPVGPVGLVFPVHMNGLPVPVRTFLRMADFSSVDYLYAVATHGGLPGNAGGLINRILSEAASSPHLLDEFFSLEMILNTPKGVAPRPLMRMNWAETITAAQVDAMVERTDTELAAIIVSISMRTTGFAARYRTDRHLRGTLGTRLLWRLTEWPTPRLPFLLDEQACTRCGTCRDVCPSGRVVLNSSGSPSWPARSPCYFCYACFNYCPEEAVGVKHYRKRDGRYHYPGISADDIAESN